MSLARNIKIELEIHVITCPGVWLCQNNGDIELSITALGYKFSAIPLPPRFPLCYHEKFIMDGYFSDVISNIDLENALAEEQISFTLWQKGRRLAYYTNSIGVILNYTGCLNNNFAITDNAIIMTRASSFPGTISPKIEYTASIQYITKCVKCNRIVTKQNHGDKRIIKNLYENSANKLIENFLHQKPVCHAKHRQRWRHTEHYLGHPSVMRKCNEENDLCDYCLDPKDIGKHALYVSRNHGNLKCSSDNHNIEKIDLVTQPANCGHSMGNRGSDESFHSENKCQICLKYAALFNESNEIKCDYAIF